MEIILNDYHKKVNAEMRAKVEYRKSASAAARRVYEEIEALAGTTYCRSTIGRLFP